MRNKIGLFSKLLTLAALCSVSTKIRGAASRFGLTRYPHPLGPARKRQPIRRPPFLSGSDDAPTTATEAGGNNLSSQRCGCLITVLDCPTEISFFPRQAEMQHLCALILVSKGGGIAHLACGIEFFVENCREGSKSKNTYITGRQKATSRQHPSRGRLALQTFARPSF